jgi:hypothetical protein
MLETPTAGGNAPDPYHDKRMGADARSIWPIVVAARALEFEGQLWPDLAQTFARYPISLDQRYFRKGRRAALI